MSHLSKIISARSVNVILGYFAQVDELAYRRFAALRLLAAYSRPKSL